MKFGCIFAHLQMTNWEMEYVEKIIDEKIQGKALRDIIKEKAISLNRKEKQSTKHS